MSNPILNPKMYARITGFALAATALLGIVMQFANKGTFMPGFLNFDWTHDIVHVVLALVALAAGFLAQGAYARNYARIFGIVYTGLAVVGFVNGQALSFVSLNIELGENLVHVLIGVWGLAAGFLGSPSDTTPPTPAPRRTA